MTTSPDQGDDVPGRAEYRALIDKVDAFARRAETLQSEWLVCRPGCDGCCRLRRTAWAVEIDHLRRFVATLPSGRQSALRDRLDTPAVMAGERCVFLDDDGRCAVYSARPVICRTHGPAIRLPDGGLTWCGLNFAELDAEAVADLVPADGVLDLDLLDRLLVMINARFVDGRAEPIRAPLDDALRSDA